MRRPNKTLRRKRQTRQRSRRRNHKGRRQTRRQRGGGLPVPGGAVVAISTGGEYGVPLLISQKEADELLEKGGLEE